VFDITNRASFEGLDKWFEQIKTYGSPDTTILIVGNKTVRLGHIAYYRSVTNEYGVFRT
jgi:GTPase SAR1 family protein